jgi:hypothetical protein
MRVCRLPFQNTRQRIENTSFHLPLRLIVLDLKCRNMHKLKVDLHEISWFKLFCPIEPNWASD